MLTLITNPFPELSSLRLKLRRVKVEDANEVYFLRSDKSVLKFLDKRPADSIEDALEFIQRLNDLENENSAITWGITIKDDTRLIGTISLWNILKEHYRAEVGYVLHPQFQGKGIMQEALTIVLDYGFHSMNLHSIEAIVNPHNQSSIKLLVRNSFKREGYFKENYYFNGQFLVSEIYSLLVSDYK